MADLLTDCIARSATLWAVATPEGVLLEASPGLEVLLDRDRSAIVGARVWHIGGMSRGEWLDLTQRLDAERIVEFETSMPDAAGAALPIRARFEAVTDRDGQRRILCRIERPGSVGGIFEPSAADAGSGDGVWVHDVASDTVAFDARWYARLGLPPRPREPRSMLLRLHADDVSEMAARYADLIDGRRSQISMRVGLLHADGSLVWGRRRVSVLKRDADGRAITVVGHDVDTKAELFGERAALREEARLRRLLERIPTAIVVYDPQGRPQHWNRAAAELLGVAGRDVADTIARHRADGWHMVDGVGQPLPDDWAPVFDALQTGAALPGQLVGVIGDGRVRWGMLETSPGFDTEGRLVDVVCTFTDVTATRELEADLARAQRLESLGRLASGVAHDFNNLLTVVLSAAELLADEIEPASLAGIEVSELQHAAARGADLTRQLLSYARPVPLDPHPFDPGEHLRRAEGLLRRLLPGDIELSTDAPDDLWLVDFEAAQLDRILVNLAVNAADAMAVGGGRLSITLANRASAAGERVRLRVTDTGCGMSPEVLARATEPFFTTKREGSGTGLGLSNCAGLLRRHGGDLRIRSIEGVGTTVDVDLPRAVRSEALTPRPSRPPQRLGGERVLLVEDEAPVREAIWRALVANGFEVIVARDGLDALRCLDDGAEPEMVITDVAMPRMDGPSFVRTLHERDPQMPVLFVSGHDDPSLGRHRFDRTRVEFLAKPFGPRELVFRMESLLRRSKTRPRAAG